LILKFIDTMEWKKHLCVYRAKHMSHMQNRFNLKIMIDLIR